MRGWHLFDAVLCSHRRTPPLTEVEPPAASGHWRFLRRPEIFTGFDALLWAERTASGLRKKPRPRRASFVNNFFTDVGYFCGNVRAVCVIVSPTNSPEATSRRISNITVSTVRKMCACNTAQPLDLRPLSSWQGGFPTPVSIPPARACRPCPCPPLRGVDARIAPWPVLAPWPVPCAPCRPAGLTCWSWRIVRRLGRRLKPDPVGRSGGAHRGRCVRRGLDALRPGDTPSGRKPSVNST
jgi:hypothetical protein